MQKSYLLNYGVKSAVKLVYRVIIVRSNASTIILCDKKGQLIREVSFEVNMAVMLLLVKCYDKK